MENLTPSARPCWIVFWWQHQVMQGGGLRAVVSTGLGGLKETKMFLPRVKVSIVGSLRDREVACSASDRQGSNFESCVLRTVSSHSSHHPQEVLLAQFSLYVHKGGLKPDLFHYQAMQCITHPNWCLTKYLIIVGFSVIDSGPALKQHWVDVFCLLDR